MGCRLSQQYLEESVGRVRLQHSKDNQKIVAETGRERDAKSQR